MPKKVEKALKKKAEEMHLSEERAKAYIYGTMHKLGLLPKKK